MQNETNKSHICVCPVERPTRLIGLEPTNMIHEETQVLTRALVTAAGKIVIGAETEGEGSRAKSAQSAERGFYYTENHFCEFKMI